MFALVPVGGPLVVPSYQKLVTYDAMNRLTTVAKGATSASFWYDGFNRVCTWQENGSANHKFNVWDGWNLVAEYGESNALQSEYLHGALSDEMVSMIKNGQTYYYFQDGRGNTSHLVNSSGALVETCRYDVFGAPTVTVATGQSATGNRFLFTGREYFASVGHYNSRNRFYMPEWGRFLQPDPIGFASDPANLYRYCANNPVNASDPSGLGDRLVRLPNGFGLGIDAPKKQLDSSGGSGGPSSYQGSGLGIFGGLGISFGGNAQSSRGGEPGVNQGLRLGDTGIDHTLPSGVGPVVNRTFTTVVNSGVLTADALIAGLKGNLNQFAHSSNWYSGLSFSPLDGSPNAILLGNSFAVDIPGPWNGNVIVSNVTGSSFTFSTLAGHPESGSISFSAFDSSSGHVTFTIESTFQASSQFSQFASQYLGGHRLQSAVWWNFSSNVINYGGGLGTTTSAEQTWGP